MNNNELYHYGVLGMKWGVRKAKQYEYKADRLSRKIDDKKSKGKILTVRDGTKIRAIANFRSRANDLKANRKVSISERNINAKNAMEKAMQEGKTYNRKIRAARKLAKTRSMSSDAKEAYSLKKKKVSQLSNSELKKLNERQNLERTYKQNNKSKIAIGLAAAGTAITVLGRIGSIEDNIGKIGKLAKRGKAIIKR